MAVNRGSFDRGAAPGARRAASRGAPAAAAGSSGVGLLIAICAVVICLVGAATYLVRQRFAPVGQAAAAAVDPRSAPAASSAPAPATGPAGARRDPAAQPGDLQAPDVSQLYFGGREGRWWNARLRELRERKDDRLYQLTVKRAEANGLRVVDGPDGPEIAAGPELVAALRGGARP